MGDVQGLLRAFAGLLEYPTSDLQGLACECLDHLTSSGSPAALPMQRFCRVIQETSLARMEEVYTRTFDLQAACSPYVGYHLFGESYKRGTFMARLNEGYRLRGFSTGNELPDHIAQVLRFLALGSEDEFSRALRAEGLGSALVKMAQALQRPSDNPYSEVLGALSLALGVGETRGVDDA